MLQQSLTDRVPTKIPWFWLFIIAVIGSSYGWMLAQYNSLFALMVTLSITLAVAVVRASHRAGFPVWAGLWSLTFGTVFIAIGTLISIGAFGWAIAVFAWGAGIFLLELAIAKVLTAMNLFGFEPSQSSLILATVAAGGIISGWIAHLILI